MRSRSARPRQVPELIHGESVRGRVQVLHAQDLVGLPELCAVIGVAAVVGKKVYEILGATQPGPAPARSGNAPRYPRRPMYEVGRAPIILRIRAIVSNGEYVLIRVQVIIR